MRRNLMLLAAAAIGLTASVASAADLPRKAYTPPAPLPPPPTWTGFYGGVNAGWGWSGASGDVLVSGPVGTIFRSGAETSNNPNGALVGITLGYNYQFAPNWVFGVEGDFDGAGISGTRQFGPVASANPAFFDAGQVNTKISWLATLRGRLGYTWGPGMIYVTGGGAWEDISIKGVVSEGDFGTSAVFNNSKTQSGWTVGGGYEWMFVPNWSAKIEYLYYQFNNNGTFGTNFFNQPTSFATITDVKQHLNTVRVGVNYHF